MQIIITKKHFDLIVKHCKEYYPAEAVGYLGGKGNVILGIYPVPNYGYLDGLEKVMSRMSEQDIAKTINYFNKHKLDFLGTYHSHPSRNIPIASHGDLNSSRASSEKYMIIVSLDDLKSTQFACYSTKPKYSHVKINVIKDSAVDKYLFKADVNITSEEYQNRIKELDARLSEMIERNNKDNKS